MRKIRKAICLILALLLIIIVSCSPGLSGGHGSTSGNNDNTPPITSFYDIPGITEDEIAGITALQSRRTHFVYGMTPSTETFYDINNEIRGFSALFCEWLTELFGIAFIPEIHEWGYLSAGLENHTVDFTGELTETQERLQSGYFMTGTIAERTLKYMRLADSLPLPEIAAVAH